MKATGLMQLLSNPELDYRLNKGKFLKFQALSNRTILLNATHLKTLKSRSTTSLSPAMVDVFNQQDNKATYFLFTNNIEVEINITDADSLYRFSCGVNVDDRMFFRFTDKDGESLLINTDELLYMSVHNDLLEEGRRISWRNAPL